MEIENVVEHGSVLPVPKISRITFAEEAWKEVLDNLSTKGLINKRAKFLIEAVRPKITEDCLKSLHSYLNDGTIQSIKGANREGNNALAYWKLEFFGECFVMKNSTYRLINASPKILKAIGETLGDPTWKRY